MIKGITRVTITQVVFFWSEDVTTTVMGYPQLKISSMNITKKRGVR